MKGHYIDAVGLIPLVPVAFSYIVWEISGFLRRNRYFTRAQRKVMRKQTKSEIQSIVSGGLFTDKDTENK